MIDLYYCPTPNCQKVSIALEELDIPYQIHSIDIVAGDQNEPEFSKMFPNRKVPAIVDHDGAEGRTVVLSESAAILLYLVKKAGDGSGKKGESLWPTGLAEQAHGYQWLFWQMSYVGPMMGQLHHFVQYAPEKLEYPIHRYTQEVERLRRMLNEHLKGKEYILDNYSIADIACFPWFKMFSMRYENQAPYPFLDAWLEKVFVRPAVQKGFALEFDKIRPVVVGAEPVTDAVRKHLFASYQDDDGSTA